MSKDPIKRKSATGDAAKTAPLGEKLVLRDQRGLVNRVKRLRGQIDAIERSLVSQATCSELLQRITAARGAVNGLLAEVLEEHVREYLVGPAVKGDEATRIDAGEELIEIIHSYLT